MNRTVEVTAEEKAENEKPLSVADLTSLVSLCLRRINQTKSEKTVRKYRTLVVKLNRLMMAELAK